MRRRSSAVAGALLVALALTTAQAKEVDQFTDRLFQLEHLRDASAVLDARMNRMLDHLAAELDAHHARTDRARDALAYREFQGGDIELLAQLDTPYETWVRNDADVDLYWVDDRGIYGGAVDYDDMGFGWYVEIAPVIRIGERLVGIDKLGHFLGQGWFYYREQHRQRAAHPRATTAQIDDLVRKSGHELEASFLGLSGTGVYSYADLAANWQGLQFYRALFAGDAPYLVSGADGHYHRVRDFHFADYATDDWDEVLNPSRPRTAQFYGKVARFVRDHACASFAAAPERYLNATGRALGEPAYVWSGAGQFGYARRFAIGEICAAMSTTTTAAAAAGATRSTAPPAAP